MIFVSQLSQRIPYNYLYRGECNFFRGSGWGSGRGYSFFPYFFFFILGTKTNAKVKIV